MTVYADTPLIRISDLAYPKYLADVRRENPNTSFGPTPSDELILGLGYGVVQIVAQPAVAINEIAEEGPPVLQEGGWVQVWNVRTLTAEEDAAKLMMLQEQYGWQIDALLEQAREVGFKYDFGGAYGLQTIQQRAIDCNNLTGLGLRADRYVAAGEPTAQMAFRTGENIWVPMPATEMVDLTNASYDFVVMAYGASTALKDATAAATTLLELPVIPVELFAQPTLPNPA